MKKLLTNEWLKGAGIIVLGVLIFWIIPQTIIFSLPLSDPDRLFIFAVYFLCFSLLVTVVTLIYVMINRN